MPYETVTRQGLLILAFLRELFLSNGFLPMFYAPANLTATLDELAELADKVVEVAALSVATVDSPQLVSEVEQFCAELPSCKLRSKLSLKKHVYTIDNPQFPPPVPPVQTCAGITTNQGSSPTMQTTLCQSHSVKRPGQLLVVTGL